MTRHIELEHRGGYSLVTLNRPRANAIGTQMVTELLAAIDELEAEPGLRAMLLTGAPGMFSAGLDVPELMQLDRAAMTDFWKDFNALCYRLFTSDLMIVTAISGHSPAGGCVLAIMTDYRIMAAGRYKIGLNEVAVGIPIPGGLTDIYASLIGLPAAQDLGCRGAMVGPDQALELGLIQEVVEAGELQQAAEAKIAQYLACSEQAQVTTKQLFRRQLAAILHATSERDQKAFLDLWFGDDAQAVLKALVARLG